MSELPLEAATADVIARYKRGNDYLASCAAAMRRLRERVEAGEAGEGWDWPKYRGVHLEPHIKIRWIQQQLALAPRGATKDEISKNVARHHEKVRGAVKKHRDASALRNAPPAEPLAAADAGEGAVPDEAYSTRASPTPLDGPEFREGSHHLSPDVELPADYASVDSISPRDAASLIAQGLAIAIQNSRFVTPEQVVEYYRVKNIPAPPGEYWEWIEDFRYWMMA